MSQRVHPFGADADLRVLDLSGDIAGAYCTKLLAEGGADVIKIESPAGDPLRSWSASGATTDRVRGGGLFQHLCGSKRSFVPDLELASDDDVVRQLVEAADVIVWSPVRSSAAEIGADPRALRLDAPDATIVAITPVGLEGPWAGRSHTEFTLQASAGGVAGRGRPSGPPVAVGGRTGEWIAGMFAAAGVLLSRFQRGGTVGGGELLDVSMLESLVITHTMCPVTADKLMRRPGRRLQFPSIEAAQDGLVGVTIGTRDHWRSFCKMIGQDAWSEDASLLAFASRWARFEELGPTIAAWMAAHTVEQVEREAVAARVPFSEIGNGVSLPTFAHLVERETFATNDDGVVGPRRCYELRSHTPIGRSHPGSAPTLGQDNEAIRSQPWQPRINRTSSSVSGTELPLAGLRVAEFTTTWAGPYLAQQLAIFGADVVRVESVQRPDETRFVGGMSGGDGWWETCLFSGLNTNKRDVTLNMDDPRGRELALRLCLESDVVIDNYSPRVMEKWGLDWDSLSAKRPGLIQVRMPGFGLSGPWRDLPSYGMTGEQLSGLAWLTGFPDELPQLPGGLCDPVASGHALVGLMLALDHQRRTGEGVLVEMPLVSAAISIAAEQVAEHSVTGALLSRQGNRGHTAAPQGLYRSDDVGENGLQDRWVAIAVETDEQWRNLVDVLDGPSWAVADELATAAGRHRQHDRIDEHLSEWVGSRSADDVVEVIARACVPVAKVVTPHELLDNPQLEHRGWWSTVEHPIGGDEVHNGHPVSFADRDRPLRFRRAPLLGEHNADVLTGLLGVDAAALDLLEADDVIGRTPLVARQGR